MNIFDDAFRTLVSIVLLFLIPYFLFLIRFVIREIRDIDETMHEAVRILKEIRDHQKGIKRKKIKSE